MMVPVSFLLISQICRILVQQFIVLVNTLHKCSSSKCRNMMEING
jgi:hypothetical protein